MAASGALVLEDGVEVDDAASDSDSGSEDVESTPNASFEVADERTISVTITTEIDTAPTTRRMVARDRFEVI